MRSSRVRDVVWALLVGTLCLAPACGDDGGATSPDAAAPDAAPDAPGPPIFRNVLTLDDDTLAREALGRLGVEAAGVPGDTDTACVKCHAVSAQRLRSWAALTDEAATCLTDFRVTDPAAARQMVACLRDDGGTFAPQRLGVWATAASLPWFEYLFLIAGEPSASYDELVARVSMPRGEHQPFTQVDFDVVAEWFARGLPLLDTYLPIDVPPDECVPAISADLTAHVTRMATEGWSAVNRDAGMLMHGCPDPASSAGCLADAPRVERWEVAGQGALRQLFTIPYTTDYWTRSSPDGRFVAHGAHGGALGSYGAAFIDLADGRVIPANAYYDPAFFPDGSGFVFHGGAAAICPEHVLTDGGDDVTFREAGCLRTREIGLYEQVGAGLGGGDLWVVDGQFENDDGGHEPTLENPIAAFTRDAHLWVTSIVADAGTFTVGEGTPILTPFEGDPIMSPSARLSVQRVAGPSDRQRGWVVRRIDATPSATGYTVALPEIGRVCSIASGGKPSISFDERWMVVHRYVEPDDAVELGFLGTTDPAFAAYLSAGAANLYLVDLLDGSARRLTSMAAGEYALYPHFRSDGWIYFIVRSSDGSEQVVASDAVVAAP